MAYKATEIYASSPQEMARLKALMRTDFGNAVHIMDIMDCKKFAWPGQDGPYLGFMKTEPLDRKSKSTLRNMGFEVNDLTCYGSSISRSETELRAELARNTADTTAPAIAAAPQAVAQGISVSKPLKFLKRTP